jgi:hypothetical protein
LAILIIFIYCKTTFIRKRKHFVSFVRTLSIHCALLIVNQMFYAVLYGWRRFDRKNCSPLTSLSQKSQGWGQSQRMITITISVMCHRKLLITITIIIIWQFFLRLPFRLRSWLRLPPPWQVDYDYIFFLWFLITTTITIDPNVWEKKPLILAPSVKK